MSFLKSHLDWNQALLPAVTQRLLSTKSVKWMDLSDTLVVLPTVQSGRRLRESLALAATQSSGGLLPPLILTPDGVLTEALKGTHTASAPCVTTAWVKILNHIDPTQFKTLFPVKPAQTIGWQFGMAQRFIQLRNQLGEEGLSIADTAKKIAETGGETERWRQLARLEALYLEQLESRDLADPQKARYKAASNYKPPEGIKRIILAATPDPQALPLYALRQASKRFPVEIWIYGPDENLFDDSGRPLSKKWIQRALPFEKWNCRMETFTDLKATAQCITQYIQKAPPESVLIGLANAELAPIVTEALNHGKIPNYDPGGTALHHGGPGRLAELLVQLAEYPGTITVRTLLQHPDISEWAGIDSASGKQLRTLDQIVERHLTADLNALIRFCQDPALSRTLEEIRKLQHKLARSENFGQALAHALQSIYTGKEKRSSGDTNTFWSEQAEAVRKLLESAKEVADRFDSLSPEFERTAFKQALKQTKVYPDRPKNAHDLLGWLELLWNDAPHLILAGMNEGNVPESIVGDAFLPETLREQLNLRTNEQRFARDAYLLEALCRRRAENGRIDILVPKSANDGIPLKPSRLLFQGEPETLLPRTEKLFSKPPKIDIRSSHAPAWELSPPQGLAMPESFSVSSLKNYLECPFRFFLRHIMKMRTLDVEARELTLATFGTLFHDTVAHLKGMALDSSIKQANLAKKLHEIAEDELHRKYGKNRSFALRLQQETLMARITAFCERQIEDVHKNGSTTVCETEIDFTMPIEGVTIKGVIDRIDKRDGRTELVDYKTADHPRTPPEAHLSKITHKALPTHLPNEAHFVHEGASYYWTDLQLPLYALSKRQNEGERPKVAYFNLAKTLDKSRLATWEDFTDSHLTAAHECAGAVIRQIKAGVFWPPNPDVREAYDDFAPFFPEGIENSVNADAFRNYPFK